METHSLVEHRTSPRLDFRSSDADTVSRRMWEQSIESPQLMHAAATLQDVGMTARCRCKAQHHVLLSAACDSEQITVHVYTTRQQWGRQALVPGGAQKLLGVYTRRLSTYSRCQTLCKSNYTEKMNCCKSRRQVPSAP